MTKRTTAERLDKLEASLASMAATLETLAHRVVATTPATTTPATTTPTVKVQPRRPAPPLPQRPAPTTPTVKVQPRPAPAPAATTAPTTAPTTPAAAHAAADRCFLGCRTSRGHQSRPSTGLVEIATGAYWHKGEGNGTRLDPRPGALNAHAAAGTVWPAVNDSTGQAGEMSAQTILAALEEMRREDGQGNRGAPAVLCGEEALNGWRLAPAPFRRATLAEKMASDDEAYRRLVALAAEATAARKRMGLA